MISTDELIVITLQDTNERKGIHSTNILLDTHIFPRLPPCMDILGDVR